MHAFGRTLSRFNVRELAMNEFAVDSAVGVRHFREDGQSCAISSARSLSLSLHALENVNSREREMVSPKSDSFEGKLFK